MSLSIATEHVAGSYPVSIFGGVCSPSVHGVHHPCGAPSLNHSERHHPAAVRAPCSSQPSSLVPTDYALEVSLRLPSLPLVLGPNPLLDLSGCNSIVHWDNFWAANHLYAVYPTLSSRLVFGSFLFSWTYSGSNLQIICGMNGRLQCSYYQ